jgi:two-component system CheB/CheR fusion protein
VPGGEPSYNLLRVVRPELREEVRAALYQAMEQRTAVEAKGVALRLDDQDVRLNVTVRPVVEGETSLFVVLFDEVHGDTTASDATAPLPLRYGEVPRQLEEEATRLRVQLRALLERYELHVEEHNASLEEQQAMNEELRSSAEELETSREELQSLNEELQTVNQELKVDEQAQANDDMRNLVNATEIGTVFLDRTRRIKLFTPAVRTVFNLIPADRGRPLFDINSTLLHADLHEDVERVMETLERVEREVQTRDDRWLLMRVHPYRTIDDRIDGVVLTFVDITDRKRAADRIQSSEERLRRATGIDNVGVMFFSGDGVISNANDAFLRMSGYTREALDQRRLRWEDITPAEWKPVSHRALEEFRATGKTTPHERELIASDGTRSWALCAAAHLGPDEGVEFIVDITASKRIEDELRRSEARLRLIVDGVTDYAIFTLDAAGCIDHWNRGAERMFGYAEGDIIGRPVSVLFTPEDRAAGVDREELSEARESGRASDDRWHIRKDGTRFFVSGMTAPLYSSPDRLLGYVKVARDLTDRKEWEDALQQAHTTLELRVEDRTKELAAANRILDAEVQDRRRGEEQIRGLLGRLIGVQEDERQRIARDLHDHIGQQIVGLGLMLEALQQVPEPTRRWSEKSTTRGRPSRNSIAISTLSCGSFVRQVSTIWD